jgi:predicted nucleic acid-binding protein
MYTVDASVWVNAFDQREPGHESSRQLLDLLSTQAIPVIVPNLVLVEVAGAISRTRNNPGQALAFATALSNLPNVTIMPLHDVLAQQALALAAQHGLRGADSVYAAVAVQSGCTLITLDNEHLTRLAGIVTTRTPATVLADLTSPPSAS